MAKIVTMKILVESEVESDEAINDLVKMALVRSQPDNKILDFEVREIQEIAVELGDSIVNETYITGNAFDSWIIFSASEVEEGAENSGYWSNQFGWTSYDLANRFDPIARDLPPSAGNDACMIIDF